MARLRRQWGVQTRTLSGDWPPDASWAADRQAAYSGVDALYPEGDARVVSRVVSDWEPDPVGPQSPACAGTPGCCAACRGSGSSLSDQGPCWDCRGTGHPHPLEVVTDGQASA